MESALAFFRFAQYSATIFLFGGSCFISVIARGPLQKRLLEGFSVFLLLLSLLLPISWLGWLFIQTGSMGDGWRDIANPELITTVLLDTYFGSVWLLRFLFMTVLLATFIIASNSTLTQQTVLSGLLLASLGPIGHPSMLEGFMGQYLILNNALHLLAAGLWVGGLLPLSACLVVFPHSIYQIDLAICLRRYSSFGQLAVCLVLVTGALNAFMILGTFPSDWTSQYQSILFVKILLVAVMIGIALFNRYILNPAVRASAPKVLRALIVGSWVEIGISAAVICLVGFLGQLQPI